MLLDEGFRVVALDMLGYGDSACLPFNLRNPLPTPLTGLYRRRPSFLPHRFVPIPTKAWPTIFENWPGSWTAPPSSLEGMIGTFVSSEPFLDLVAR